MDAWKQQPGMLGLRFVFLQPHQQSWPVDGTIDWLWPAAERAGVPVALLAATFLALVGQVAERHPGLKLIVDHLGRTSGKTDGEAFENLSEMLALAKYPNVAIKALVRPATPLTRIRVATSTATFSRSTTRSARSGCSGAPTLPGCPARGDNA